LFKSTRIEQLTYELARYKRLRFARTSEQSLELLKMIIPKLSRVAVLWDTTSGPYLSLESAASHRLSEKLQVLEIRSPEEIDDVGKRSRRPAQLNAGACRSYITQLALSAH